jgi:hypothetical protein
MTDNELKDLPPEDRIKKLKELEKKRKEEIVEAQKLIKESQDELTARQEWKDKVPIPEVAQEESAGLSEDARQILKEQRGTLQPQKQYVVTDTPPQKRETASPLEETVHEEALHHDVPPAVLGAEYTAHLSQEPIGSLYHEMSALNESIGAKGYMNPEEQRKVEYMLGAVEKKIEAEHAGAYSFTEETARAASVTQQLGARMMYQQQKDQRNVYSSE